MVFESLRLILEAGVDHELRCTWHPDLLPATDLAALRDELTALGTDCLVVQECRPTGRAAALPAIPPGRRYGIGELAGRFEHFTLRAARGAPG